MKRYLLLVLILSLSVSKISAQSLLHPFSMGISGGLTQYNGDLGQGIFDFSQPKYSHVEIGTSWYINPHWDFSMNSSYGTIGHFENENKNFKGEQITWSGHFNYNILNSDTKKVIPYLFGGIGVGFLQKYNIKAGTDFYVPFGAGLRVQLTDRISLNLKETFAYADHDDRDGEAHDNNDGFALHSLGIFYSFNGAKDADKDGISDKKDKCADTPAGVKTDEKGCPLDRDGDTVADYLDSCPDVKGSILAKGCPDRDNDGITDAIDKCADLAGIASMNGCPDKDGDGITDADDKCPDAKGIASMNGCPDSDEDGITDAEDACPSEKGSILMKGCPDTDGDNVADKDDKCPDVAGVIANKGCPEIKEEVKALFTRALQGIQFETGKDVIRKSSNTILDNIASIMNENSAYLLSISGHTDNTGDASKNIILSQKRADAVKNYLVNKGVAANRLTASGYGQTVPVADNKTESGRSKNRRVEFKVSF